MNQKILNDRYRSLEVSPLCDRVRLLLQVLAGVVSPPCTLMDVGCAAGSITRQFKRLPGIREIIGVDGSFEALEEAKKICDTVQYSDLNIKIVWKSSRVDVIVSSYVMEHLTGNEQYLREMYRVLKPGGRMLLQVVNLAAWCNRLALLIGWQPWFTECGNEKNYGNPLRGGADGIAGHMRYHVPKAFRAMLKAAGFIIERQIGFSELTRAKALDRLVSRLWVDGSTGILFLCKK